MARTAAEAGVSVGLVQHYFSSKDDMLRYAYTQVTERALDRALVRAEEIDQHGGRIQEALQQSLTARLPLDEEQVRARLARAIANGKKCGEVRARTDPEAAAARLLAYLDGLALHTCLEPAALSATDALHDYLSGVFPGRCRAHES